jgi:hypothetical protein
MMVQTESRTRRQRIEQAVAYALDRDWDLAVEENRALLEDDPDDVEAANRLGKALTELGDVASAIEAYERARAIDPTNAIARKNLARLSGLKPASSQPARKGSKARKSPAKRSRSRSEAGDLRLHALIEESSKAAEFALLRPNAQALKRVAAGDAASVEPAEHGVVVKSMTGAALGTIEPRAGLRLKRMMEGGNQYAAVIRHVTDGEAIVHIREALADPSLAGQASFIAPPADSTKRRRAPRAYTRAPTVQRDQDAPEAEDDEDEEDGGRPNRSVRTRRGAGEMEERGFSETRPVDDATDEESEEFDDDDEEDEEE